MNTYYLLYLLHISSVTISGAFFFVRGIWMMRESNLLQAKWVRISPHIIDTVLLLSAIALAVMSHQYPFVEAWLTVKVVLLLAYIGLGVFALRRGKTRSQRMVFFVIALLTFGFMVSVALTRNPAGLFALL